MDQSPEINFRLGSKAQEFRSSGSFTDVILRYNSEEFPAHRIILAKFSGWFKKYFTADKTVLKPNCQITIDIPENPEDSIKTVLTALYEGKLKLTVENAPAILKICVFYEIPHLTVAVRNFVSDSVNQTTVLHYARRFIEYGLLQDAKGLAGIIAEELDKYYKNPGVPGNITEQQIFEAVSDGRVFADVVSHEKMVSSQACNTEEKVVGIIDKYVGERIITNIEEQEALASIINWEQPESYLYLVKFKCDWLPARIYRKLVCKVIDNRRKNANCFEEDSNKQGKDVSRWFVFSWITSVSKAIETKSTPVVKINEFIRTLGGESKPFNPVLFGIVDAKVVGRIAGKIYGPENILDGTDSFLSITSGQKEAAVSLLFGKHDTLNISKITFDFKVFRTPNSGAQTIGKEEDKYFKVPSYVDIQSKLNGNENTKLQFKGISDLTEADLNQKFNEITFSYAGSVITIFRIANVEFVGQFL